MNLQASLAKKRSAYRQDLEKASRSILRQLSAMPEVEKVFLFGSYAAGRRDLFTDLDLLVVMDTPKNFITRTTELYRKIQSGVDLDMLVYTPEEFEQQKNKPFIRKSLWSLGRTTLRRGFQIPAGICGQGSSLKLAGWLLYSHALPQCVARWDSSKCLHTGGGSVGSRFGGRGGELGEGVARLTKVTVTWYFKALARSRTCDCHLLQS